LVLSPLVLELPDELVVSVLSLGVGMWPLTEGALDRRRILRCSLKEGMLDLERARAVVQTVARWS
jgi:hypothetical protein